MKTYYVNQMPVESIAFAVVDEARKARSLTAYTSATVLFTAPDGTAINGGAATITNAATGSVTYTFPGQVLFTQRGDYKMQLRLENANRRDYADIMTVRVIESLEVAT